MTDDRMDSGSLSSTQIQGTESSSHFAQLSDCSYSSIDWAREMNGTPKLNAQSVVPKVEEKTLNTVKENKETKRVSFIGKKSVVKQKKIVEQHEIKESNELKDNKQNEKKKKKEKEVKESRQINAKISIKPIKEKHKRKSKK